MRFRLSMKNPLASTWNALFVSAMPVALALGVYSPETLGHARLSRALRALLPEAQAKRLPAQTGAAKAKTEARLKPQPSTAEVQALQAYDARVLKLYAASFFTEVNVGLRNTLHSLFSEEIDGVPLKGTPVLAGRGAWDKSQFKLALHLKQALDRLPPHAADEGRVFRGLKPSPGVNGLFAQGRLFSDPGFLSTSLSREVGVRFATRTDNGETLSGGVLVEITSSKTGRHIEKFVHDPTLPPESNEREVLFKPDSVFLVDEVAPNTELLPGVRGTLVRMRELLPEELTEARKTELQELRKKHQDELVETFYFRPSPRGGMEILRSLRTDTLAAFQAMQELKKSGELEKRDLSEETFSHLLEEGGG